MASDPARRHRPVRTPTVLQMEATECGAAALGIILEYHGRYVPLDVLREDCGVSRDGSNAFYIREAAKRHGLETSAFRKPADGLWTRKPPIMVFWQWNHFLVVEGFSRGKVYLNDPASGRRFVSFAEFEEGYSGIAFSFTPGPGFEPRGGRPGVWKGLSQRLASSRTALGFVILAGLVLVAPALVSASFQRIFIDEILIEGRRDWLKPLLIGMGLTALVRLAAVTLQQEYLTRLEIRMALSESVQFVHHLLRLPLNFYQHRYAGDLVSRAVSTARVAQLVSGELATTAVSFLTVIFFVAVMLPHDPFLTAVGVAISGLNLLALRWLSQWRVDRNRTIEQVRGRLAASLMWAIQIIETVKATGAESDLLARWAGRQARVVGSEQELGAYDAVLTTLPPFLSVSTTIVILGLGGREVAAGSLTIGSLIAFQTLLVYFNQPFQDFARLGAEVQELQADLDRIDDVRGCRVDPLVEPRPAAGPATSWPSRLDGRLELRSVTFGYNRTVDEPLIKDFSMEIRPGRRVALVGGSGAGKSTIARLVVGLHQPWSGEVLHDGRPIGEIPREVFVQSVSLVDERISMFQGTVRDNLTLWDEAVSVDRLTHAGLSAAVHGDLLQRRGGYDAVVAEQARNFSGGQRQRLEIARAVVRDPSLLVLDEATSALDPRTEAIVDDHLRRRGCSCLIVAHRLSTIRDCDEIIVLSAGRVVQRGTHDDLIREPGGEYVRLLSGQSIPSGRSRRLAATLAASNGRAAAPARVPVSSTTTASRIAPRAAAARKEPVGPTILTDALRTFGQLRETSANLPLPLDDPEAVWWVEGGRVDVFFTHPDGSGGPGRRKHLCRVDDGGSIFALSGVRGQSGGGLLAVGVGRARLFQFSRGDLIRLSFEESLAEQVALLIDDWIVRVARALGESLTRRARIDLDPEQPVSLDPGARFGVAKGIAWVRRLEGDLMFLDSQPLPDDGRDARFPLSEHLWMTAGVGCRVTACDTLTMVLTGDPWAGLMAFHTAVLDDFARIEHRDDEHLRAERTAAITGGPALTRWFSRKLASSDDDPTFDLVDPGADLLLAACQAACRELGVDVRAPRRRSDDEPERGGHPLSEIARASGLLIRPVTLSPGWHGRAPSGPLLAELDDGGTRPVALIPPPGWRRLLRRTYEVVDPSRGTRRPVDAALADRIAPRAWSFNGPLPDDRLSLMDLVRFCRRRVRGETRLALVLALASALLGLGIPIGVGVLVDDVIPDADLPTLGWSRLSVLCSSLLALAYSVAMLQVFQRLTMLRIEGKLVSSVVPAVWDRLLRLPSRFFSSYSSGDLALRSMGLGVLFKKATGAAITMVVAGLGSLFNLALLFWYNWRLALIACLLVGLMSLVATAILAGQLRLESSIRRVEGSIIGFLVELVGGVSKLRTAGAEDRAFGRWAERYAEQLRLTARARGFANRLHRFFAVFPMLIAMIVYLGAVRLVDGPMTTGDFLAFTMALAGVVGSVLAVGFTLLGLLDLPPLYARLRPILETVPEFPAASVEPLPLAGALALQGVSFRYPTHDGGLGPKVLDDVSFQVLPGEFVAIVGASGSGKSTIMRLLLGFETPGAGAVLYDGRELATLDLRAVRGQIGVVLQNADLTPGDLYGNIVGFAPDLTLDDAWRAARLAGIDHDVSQLPMGMHTLVGEGGGSLSGGQRQRLLIARAVVRRPRILLLDEATSALDNVTQAIVSESLARELKGTTRVVIAHRLSTVVHADRIYVVKAGKIVQVGRYDQLVAESGPFQELAHRQTL